MVVLLLEVDTTQVQGEKYECPIFDLYNNDCVDCFN